MKCIFKLISSIVFLSSVNCFAALPSSKLEPIEYPQNIKVNTLNTANSTFALRTVKKIPEATYRYLEGVFSSFYGKIGFNTEVTDSTFTSHLESDVVAIPLIANNKRGIKFEVFGNFYDESKKYLSNLSPDHALYNSMENTENNDLLNEDLSLGAGFSFNTSQASKVKLVISNNDMPGYGSSRTLLGFETQF